MSYFRASTDNPLGWRPNAIRLGHLRHQGPDWKAAAAERDAAIRADQLRQAAAYRASSRRAAAIDARARGDRTLALYRGLSGLGLAVLSSATAMVRGAAYTFHFTINSSFWGGNIDTNNLRTTVARDPNFAGVSVAKESTGFQVSFTYAGVSSTVIGAGSELQGIINDAYFNGLGISGKAAFSWAEGGPLLTTDASGNSAVATDAAGNIISANTSSPAQSDSTDGSDNTPFNLGTFLSGLGVGGAIAIGLGVFLVLKS